jgi:hypothetical protein
MVNNKRSIVNGRINIIATIGAVAIPKIEPRDTVLVITITITPITTHIAVR